MIELAQNLKIEIQKSSLTVSEICRHAKLSRPSLYDIMNGKNLPQPETLNRLIKTLKLTEKEAIFLQKARKSDYLKTNRCKQQPLLREKKYLIKEVGAKLLSNGYELSRTSRTDNADLIIRRGKQRIPILIYAEILDFPSVLGSALFMMHTVEGNAAYVCAPAITRDHRSNSVLFGKYGVKLVSIKGLLRDLKQ